MERYQLMRSSNYYLVMDTMDGIVKLTTHSLSKAETEHSRLNRIEIEKAERALLAASGVLPAWTADDDN